MRHRFAWYAAAVLAAVFLVVSAAALIAPQAWRDAAVGAGIGAAAQVAIAAGLGALLGERRLLAAGLAVLARFAVFATVALVLVLAPGAGASVGATLLALVAVFMVGSLLEPVILGSEPSPRS